MLRDRHRAGTSDRGATRAEPRRFAALYQPWAGSVDAIFGSHTLGRWIGHLEGTPVVQPWPFGTELGVVELTRGEEPKVYGITPETGGRWTGAGGELLDEASSRVLGELEEALLSRSGGPSPLADYFARALREATGASAAAVDMVGTQAHVDGVLAYQPAGPVSEADVLHLHPWPDATVAGELGTEELRAVARTGWPEPWTTWGVDAEYRAGGETATLAVLEGDAAERVERVLGRRLSWRRTGGLAARGRQGSAVLGLRYLESRRGQPSLAERCFEPRSRDCHSALPSFVFCVENDMCWTNGGDRL